MFAGAAVAGWQAGDADDRVVLAFQLLHLSTSANDLYYHWKKYQVQHVFLSVTNKGQIRLLYVLGDFLLVHLIVWDNLLHNPVNP